MDLTNKVAIVTGGARDIGKAVSKKLAAEGAKVVINYFDNEEQATQTLIEIKGAGGEATLCQGDMTNPVDVQKVVKHSLDVYGDHIHILVNVAGGLVARKKIDEMDLNFFNFVIQLNLNSVYLMTQAVVPHMPAGGSILNFASQAGKDGGGPGASAYATAKGAVMTFTRSMAKELGPKNIRVNSLCPGMIATTFHDTFTNTAVREKVAVSTPLGREGRADEVANFVACISSSESSFVTGTNIDINGGLMFS
ncbi:SDR family NAD(P)-dependent oxidoreductase [Flammeovirga kamogawensis]|uniref:SDR family oxidoreductase n=1 Tax=Flammeovirga kamogawensis TaxID=373891 RepID=A0ABX8GUH7_9BACT|nr:SDR family oxidoreductase [Flammeovirga kamogawensis]MBB6459699.1 3-oxoacyl-[acyl-carrier protein] reductase [Flammeovirga kamogawensis]QWG07240.1 SDR family oxidoreductase [Flammeovirga kamogawensis]TRX69060.1 SDR family oxidoreductase [Flammeovirga kamogawensis]